MVGGTIMTDSRSERTIAFILYPGVTLLDLVGPLEVLSKLPPPYRTVVVAERGGPMSTSLPVEMTAGKVFDDYPDPYVLIVPGGSGGAIKAMGNEKIRDYIISADRTAMFVGSVCTGSLILAATGLLEGRQATTHWSYATFLEKLGSKYVKKRWVQDGRYITSAGVSAGIDMAFELAAQLGGVKASKMIQTGLEYDPQPPFGPIEWKDVDMDARTASIMQKMREELAGRPDLLRKLEG